MPMIIIILSFITVFLAILAPCIAMIRSREESRRFIALDERKQYLARSEGNAAWILNKRMRMMD